MKHGLNAVAACLLALLVVVALISMIMSSLGEAAGRVTFLLSRSPVPELPSALWSGLQEARFWVDALLG